MPRLPSQALPTPQKKRGRKIKHWELYKQLLANALLAFMALFYLVHLITFIIIGPVTVDETNELILWTEIVVLISVAVLAIHCFIGDIRKKPER